MKNKIKIDIGNATSKMIILCWVTIFVCTILKFFGYKEFEIPNFDFTIDIWLQRFINLCLYNLNTIAFTLILIKRKPTLKKMISILIISSIIFTISLFESIAFLKFILELIFYFCIGVLCIKDKWYKILLEVVVISVLIILYQFITVSYKNYNVNLAVFDFIPSLVLQIDYYAFILLTIIYSFKKGGYLYGYWKSILVLLSKRKRIKEDVQQNQNDVSQEVGYKLFLIVLSITQIFLVGTICYFVNNVILEYFIIIVSFFVMRKVFGNSYHAETVIRCTTLAMLVFTIATRTSLPQWLSILCNIFIGCMVAYVMYMWYYYAKYTNATGITICKGMNKENLIELSLIYNWSELEYNILCDYYVNRISLENIADRYDYSVDNIKKMKAKALKKLA